MPAEWEPQAGTWLSLPRAEGISFPGLYERVPALWLRMIEELSSGEDVHVNVLDAADEARVAALVAARRSSAASRVHSAPHPDRRAVVPRSRADLRRARPARSRSSTGATTRGAASIRRSIATTPCRGRSRRCSGSALFLPAS
jgi:hypothetical protein